MALEGPYINQVEGIAISQNVVTSSGLPTKVSEIESEIIEINEGLIQINEDINEEIENRNIALTAETNRAISAEQVLQTNIDLVSVGQINAELGVAPTVGATIANVSVAGTYTNYNNIIVSSGDLTSGLVQFRKVGSTWTKVITPINLANYATKDETFSLKGDLTLSSNNIKSLVGAYTPYMERGSLNSSGLPTTSTTQLRSVDFIEIPENNKLVVDVSANAVLRFYAHYYNSSQVFLGRVVISGKASILRSAFAGAMYLKYTLYRSDSVVLDPAFFKNSVILYDSSVLSDKIPLLENSTAINANNITQVLGAYAPVLERGTISASGVPTASTVHLRSVDFVTIPVSGIIGHVNNGSVLRCEVNYYNSSFTFISAIINSGDFNISRTSVANAAYMKLQFYKTNGEIVNVSDLASEGVLFINNPSAINTLVPSNLRGKKVLWLGTSIPFGSSSVIAGTTIKNAYPNILAKNYGFTVYNEAIPTSAVKRGRFSQKTISDPFGMTGMSWPRLSLGLSWTQAEAQDLIDNWSYWQPLIAGAPTVLTDNEKEDFLQSCHDYIFNKYWGNTATLDKPDLVIIDHGRNDFIPTSNNDSNENVDVVPTDPYDRTTTIGALNYIVKTILEKDNKVKIIIVGHYDTHESSRLISAQQTFANHWQFPLLKLWEKTGFTLNTVYTDGYWDGLGSTKTWIEHNNPLGFQNVPMINIWLSDGVHPGNDASGKANYHLAEIIGGFLNNN